MGWFPPVILGIYIRPPAYQQSSYLEFVGFIGLIYLVDVKIQQRCVMKRCLAVSTLHISTLPSGQQPADLLQFTRIRRPMQRGTGIVHHVATSTQELVESVEVRIDPGALRLRNPLETIP